MVSSNIALKPDHVGIVVLHIYRANDLPEWPNMIRMGWDMDPFVKVSIGEQVEKTEVERHKLDPVWDKEFLFHVRQQDLKLPIRLEIFDWDRFSRNDLVGSAEINVATLVQRAANRDPNTGLHPADLPSVLYFNALPLTKNPDPSRAYTRTPTITFQCVPWCYTLPVISHTSRYGSRRSRDYDTDYTHAISRREPTSIPQSPGSTPSFETIDPCTRMQTGAAAPQNRCTLHRSRRRMAISRSASPSHKSHASHHRSTVLTTGRRDGEFPKRDDAKVRALQARGTEQRTRWLIDWRCVERLTDRLVHKALWAGELSLDWDSASCLVANSSFRLQLTMRRHVVCCMGVSVNIQVPNINIFGPVPFSLYLDFIPFYYTPLLLLLYLPAWVLDTARMK
ncbi:hypothetical protein EDB84DRAFT_1655777 [Lactarius hengduanensis]|nr:hypothetical protein EDB84DRAFT_1655777 [Lactarius hengduanensis]